MRVGPSSCVRVLSIPAAAVLLPPPNAGRLTPRRPRHRPFYTPPTRPLMGPYERNQRHRKTPLEGVGGGGSSGGVSGGGGGGEGSARYC